MIVKCKGAGGAQEIGRAQEKIWIELGSKVWKREEKKGRKVKKSRKVEGVQRVRRWKCPAKPDICQITSHLTKTLVSCSNHSSLC